MNMTTRMLLMPMLVGALITAMAYIAEAAPLAQSPTEGQAIFQQKCTACHTLGGGKLVGPDLKNVTTRRQRDWLVRWISARDKLLAQKDPLATQLLRENNNVPMPNLLLADAQVAALIAYLETQAGGASGAQTAPAPAAASALSASDPAMGKALFTGTMRFQNGGPPCMGCHSISGIGALGGGALGPDLTPAFNKYGEAGLTNFLATVPLPTMNAVWGTHPLMPEEQASLRVFLQQASVSGRPPEALAELTVLAIVGTAIMLALAQLYWRNRLTAVRRPLIIR